MTSVVERSNFFDGAISLLLERSDWERSDHGAK